MSAWIDKHLNFGNTSTNRVESQHAVLKKYLDSSKCCFDKFVGCVNRLVESQHTIIKASFEKSRAVRIHKHNLHCLKLLRGFVSNEALDLIVEEHERWKNLQLDSSNCGCRLRNSCGLPCACELSMYISSGKYNPIYYILIMILNIVPVIPIYILMQVNVFHWIRLMYFGRS